jgi:hypothetical protein
MRKESISVSKNAKEDSQPSMLGRIKAGVKRLLGIQKNPAQAEAAATEVVRRRPRFEDQDGKPLRDDDRPARAEEKGGGRDGSGRRVRAEPLRVEARGVVSGGRVRVEESGGSGVGMVGVRVDVVGSGIEGDGGRGIGRSGNRGRRL